MASVTETKIMRLIFHLLCVSNAVRLIKFYISSDDNFSIYYLPL